jgi:hypothetical protein
MKKQMDPTSKTYYRSTNLGCSVSLVSSLFLGPMPRNEKTGRATIRAESYSLRSSTCDEKAKTAIAA